MSATKTVYLAAKSDAVSAWIELMNVVVGKAQAMEGGRFACFVFERGPIFWERFSIDLRVPRVVIVKDINTKELPGLIASSGRIFQIFYQSCYGEEQQQGTIVWEQLWVTVCSSIVRLYEGI